jgi:tetratricopeptide (TPR) repeat protein
LCGNLPLPLRTFAEVVLKNSLMPVENLLARLAAHAADLSPQDAAFQTSYELLSAELQTRWLMLAVFAGDFDLRAVQAVWVEASQEAAITALQSLLDASLVQWDEAKSRFRLHDMVREFCLRKADAEILETARLAHARHYAKTAAMAEQAYLEGGTGVVHGLNIFDLERPHFEGAFEWLRARSDQDSAEALVALVGAMPWTSLMRFHPIKRIEWQKTRLNCARAIGDRSQEAWSLCDLGIAYRHLGDPRNAVECHTGQEKIATAIGDKVGICNALNNLGSAHNDLGDVLKAIACYEKARPIASCLTGCDRRWVGYTLNHLGLAHADLGDSRGAIEFHKQALEIAREIGDRRGEGNALGNLGVAHKNLGDVRKAIEFYEQQLAIAREIGDRRGEGNALGNIGFAYAVLGDARKAIEFYEQALVIDREIGDRRGEGEDLWHSALAYDSLGNRAEAIDRATAALAIYEVIEDPSAAEVRAQLAKWRAAKPE